MKFRALSAAQFLWLGLALAPLAHGALAPLPLRAQAAAACPLPPDIAATFLGSKCIKVTLRMPQTFFRYYSDPKYSKGRYLTTDQFDLNTVVISRLALNQAWGNSAKKMLSVTLPAGTVVYQGIVGPQAPVYCYPGGGQQTYLNIDDIRSQTSFVWLEGPDLAVNPFICSEQDAASPR
jgi:hypothetical protein